MAHDPNKTFNTNTASSSSSSSTSQRSSNRTKQPYGQVLAAWLERNQGNDLPLPEDVSDRYTVTEKEAYYDTVADRENQALRLEDTTGSDPSLQNIPETERQELLHRVQTTLGSSEKKSTTTTKGDGGGYEVFDLQALDWHPDETLTALDGSQELLDPIVCLKEEDFHRLRLDDANDAFFYLKHTDPSFDPKNWLPPTLEARLAALRQGQQQKTIEDWKKALLGHVSQFIDIPRQTTKRTEVVFFVRRDLYLILLLDSVIASTISKGDQKQQQLFVQAAHFYAWSWMYLQRLFDAKNKIGLEGRTKKQ